MVVVVVCCARGGCKYQPHSQPRPHCCTHASACSSVADPGARTSDPTLVTATLETAAGLGRPLFALFTHPAPRVGDGLAVLMRGVAGCGPGAAAPMRDAALREGALLHHLNQALFGSGECGCVDGGGGGSRFPPFIAAMQCCSLWSAACMIGTGRPQQLPDTGSAMGCQLHMSTFWHVLTGVQHSTCTTNSVCCNPTCSLLLLPSPISMPRRRTCRPEPAAGGRLE